MPAWAGSVLPLGTCRIPRFHLRLSGLLLAQGKALLSLSNLSRIFVVLDSNWVGMGTLGVSDPAGMFGGGGELIASIVKMDMLESMFLREFLSNCIFFEGTREATLHHSGHKC